MDDEMILRTAVGLGFLPDDKALACRKMLANERASAQEALTRGGKLTRDQIRAVLLLARYDEERRTDVDLAQFIVRNGFLDREAADACLAAQEEPFLQGEVVPRLADVLVERGLMTTDQMQMVQRAKAQLEATRVQMKSATSVVPKVQPAVVVMPMKRAAPPSPRTPGPPAKFDEEKFVRHREEAGPITSTLDVMLRRAHMKDPRRGDMLVVVVEPVGDLDARSAERFGALLDSFIDDGGVLLVVDAERLGRLTREGIEVLSAAAERCRESGGDLRLCDVTPAAKKVLEMTQASGLRSYENERGAVMSFKYQ